MKRVIISGGSSGIGAATVKRFLKEGYEVFNLGRRTPSLKEANVHFIQCDVSQPEEITQTIKTITSENNIIDALVCNAGIYYSANILESSEEDFEKLININLKSCFFLSKAVLPFMIKQKKGAIVYMGSDQTLIAKKNSALYGLTKAALGSLTKSTALDFAPFGIRANLVAAGTIETPLYHRAIEDYCKRAGISTDKVHQQEALEQPLGRLGQPEEVANLVYFLCSDEALFITGATIPIDGGYTAK